MSPSRKSVTEGTKRNGEICISIVADKLHFKGHTDPW